MKASSPQKAGPLFWALVVSLLLLPASHTALAKAKALDSTKVLSVGDGTITVQTSSHPGFKITDIDIEGKKHEETPANVTTYKVTTTTEITVDGLQCTLAEVKPGMKVIVRIGVDRSVASSITATTRAPAAPQVKLAPGEQRPAPRIVDKVLAVTPNIVTMGSPGRSFSRAYRITSNTLITVNGKSSTIAAVKVGMAVHIEALDRQIASSVEAWDSKD